MEILLLIFGIVTFNIAWRARGESRHARKLLAELQEELKSLRWQISSAAPVAPAEPVRTATPVEPVAPAQPVQPVQPIKPVEPVGKAIPALAREPAPQPTGVPSAVEPGNKTGD